MSELKELKCFVAMCWHVCIAVCIAESKFHSLICQCHLLFKEIEIVLLSHITLVLRSFSWLSMMKSCDGGMSQAKGFAYLAAT